MGHPELVSASDTPGAAFWKGGAVPTLIQINIDSLTTDTGNTGQTHILRAGLAMGMVTADGNYREYDDGNDPAGIGVCLGFLWHTVNVKDSQGTARDTTGILCIGGQGLIDEDLVFGLDANGKTDLANKFLFSSSYEAS